MELVTLHTHSTFCAHAQSSLEDMVAAAHNAGISVLACTEHYPLPESFEACRHAGMDPRDLSRYKEAVFALREAYPDMEILLGCELDWLGADEERGLTAEDFADFDIVLGSVHFLDKWLFNSRKYKDRWETADVDSLWLRYIDAWCAAAESNMPYTVMAHPDVIKKFGYYPSFDLAPHYHRMAQSAAVGGRMVEVNTAGKFCSCDQYYPAPDLLKEFAQAGVACTVGTDAHRVDTIDRDILQAYDYMRAAGYAEVTVPLRGGAFKTISLK